MIISFQGLESFRISQGDLSLSVNPKSKLTDDITIISSAPFMTESKGFLISGPGEYEVKDVGVKGFLSETAYDGAKLNTIYQISFEGMNLCFLGALSNPALSPETFESLEDIDILFVPIGGAGVLEPAAAYKLAVSLEPSIIIPMHYTNDTLKKFLKEGGEEGVKPVDKLVIKKKDLDGKEGEIVILKEE
ncbi:MAG: MBL fold metallo-hydrolase [Minisyncoccota bacterium]